MMSHGYDPRLSEGAIKCPIFQTSTFVFESAEAGKAFFQIAYGLRERGPGEEYGLIYSRLNNPDLEVLEDRLSVWDGAEACAVFGSGIVTTLPSGPYTAVVRERNGQSGVGLFEVYNLQNP
jgi:methionine-gamma-lyase